MFQDFAINIEKPGPLKAQIHRSHLLGFPDRLGSVDSQ
jgi:hypothetical protein